MYLPEMSKDKECSREGGGGECHSSSEEREFAFLLCGAYVKSWINQTSSGILLYIDFNELRSLNVGTGALKLECASLRWKVCSLDCVQTILPWSSPGSSIQLYAFSYYA